MKSMKCIEPNCDNPRGGRNTRCWKHLKRLVRRNAAVRVFKQDVVMNEDIDLPPQKMS